MQQSAFRAAGCACTFEGNFVMHAAIGLNGLLHVYATSVRASGIARALGRPGGVVSSVLGASVIAAGPAAYWITIAVSMSLAFSAVAPATCCASPPPAADGDVIDAAWEPMKSPR